MSDKAINQLFMAYLHSFYCNYHWGPVPHHNFRVWLFFAYFGHLFSLFWRRGPGNPGAVLGPRILLPLHPQAFSVGVFQTCSSWCRSRVRIAQQHSEHRHCNTIFARRPIFTRVAMYIQSTLALRTPRYYGLPAIKDRS